MRLRLLPILFSVAIPLLAQPADTAQRVYASASPSVFIIVTKTDKGADLAQGTGFLTDGGKIVTNAHVVREGNAFVNIGPANIPAKVDRVDSLNVLAVLVPSVPLNGRPLAQAAKVPEPGTAIYAIGNPEGLEKTISAGMVSGVRDLDGRALLQITAPLLNGSSGGPILNEQAEVVGVAVSILEGGQNLNFAVPVTRLAGFLRGEAAVNTAFPGQVVTEITTQQVRSILREMGVTYEERQSEKGDVTYFDFDLDTYEVTLSQYKFSLMMRIDFTDTMTLAQVNEFNQNIRFGRAYIDQQGHPAVENDLSLEGGVSKAAIEAFIRGFSDTVDALGNVIEDTPGSDLSAPPTIHTRSASAKSKINMPFGGFVLWFDSKKWKPQKEESKGRQEFHHENGQGFALVISESLPLPQEAFEEIVLTNARKVDPQAKIVGRERRIVNSKEILVLQMDVTRSSVPLHFYGYYASSPTGNTQVITYTTSAAFEQNRADFTEFLNGLEIPSK